MAIKKEIIEKVVQANESDGREDEVLDEAAAASQEYINLDDKQETMAGFLKHRNTPSLSPHFWQLNKDLRLGFLRKNNIRMFDMNLLVELTDLSLQDEAWGADEMARHLILLRDTTLNLSASSEGFEIMQQGSANINITKALKEQAQQQQWSIFGRKGRKDTGEAQ